MPTPVPFDHVDAPPYFTVPQDCITKTLEESPKAVTHAISIRGIVNEIPAALRHRPPHGQTLFLKFDDVEVASTLLGYQGCNVNDAKALVNFCGFVHGFDDPFVLIHCAAGVSRSSAASLVLDAHLMRYADADKSTAVIAAECAARLYKAAHDAHALGLRTGPTNVYPNRRLIALCELQTESLKGLLRELEKHLLTPEGPWTRPFDWRTL